LLATLASRIRAATAARTIFAAGTALNLRAGWTGLGVISDVIQNQLYPPLLSFVLALLFLG